MRLIEKASILSRIKSLDRYKSLLVRRDSAFDTILVFFNLYLSLIRKR